MAEKTYIVLEGQKYTGKHKVYLAGESFPASELFGSEDSVKIALKGQDERIEQKDKEEKIYPAKEAKIEESKPSNNKSGKKK